MFNFQGGFLARLLYLASSDVLKKVSRLIVLGAIGVCEENDRRVHG